MAFEDVDRWQKDYSPQTSGLTPGPEALEDGTYDFEIVSASLGTTKNNPESIFRLRLRVLSGVHHGQIIERPTFFRQQKSMNWLGGDMVTLGFPADQWTKRGKKWSDELVEACQHLPGVRFRGKKDTSESDDGKTTYHNLYIISPASSRPMPDEPPGNGTSTDEIPF